MSKTTHIGKGVRKLRPEDLQDASDLDLEQRVARLEAIIQQLIPRPDPPPFTVRDNHGNSGQTDSS